MRSQGSWWLASWSSGACPRGSTGAKKAMRCDRSRSPVPTSCRAKAKAGHLLRSSSARAMRTVRGWTFASITAIRLGPSAETAARPTPIATPDISAAVAIRLGSVTPQRARPTLTASQGRSAQPWSTAPVRPSTRQTIYQYACQSTADECQTDADCGDPELGNWCTLVDGVRRCRILRPCF